jgi:four helix bundle protein
MQNEKTIELCARTKRYALRIIKLYASLAKTPEIQVFGMQLLRSGTSVGAQYREACRARSSAEFISKMQCVLQELDESAYWLELIVEGGIIPQARLDNLSTETEELIKIFVQSIKTARRR